MDVELLQLDTRYLLLQDMSSPQVLGQFKSHTLLHYPFLSLIPFGMIRRVTEVSTRLAFVMPVAACGNVGSREEAWKHDVILTPSWLILKPHSPRLACC